MPPGAADPATYPFKFAFSRSLSCIALMLPTSDEFVLLKPMPFAMTGSSDMENRPATSWASAIMSGIERLTNTFCAVPPTFDFA